uniref:Uncharacterized protein n=1 Tax=Glossina pallidipes TaxID=7398 RepID=A0A1A9ZJC1_GLOPL
MSTLRTGSADVLPIPIISLPALYYVTIIRYHGTSGTNGTLKLNSTFATGCIAIDIIIKTNAVTVALPALGTRAANSAKQIPANAEAIPAIKNDSVTAGPAVLYATEPARTEQLMIKFKPVN